MNRTNWSKQTKYLVALVTSVIIVSIYVGCTYGNNQTVQVVRHKEVLRVGVIPVESVDKMKDQFAKFMIYLSKKTGRKAELFVAKDYKGIIDLMVEDKLDIAWFGPFSYITANKMANAQAFAVKEKYDTGVVYHSVIIVHPDSDIKTLQDLFGRSFAYTDKLSTSGHLIPTADFKKQGLNPEKDFASVQFLGNHDAAILAVKKKKVDAAAVSNSILNMLQTKGIIGDKDIRVIYTSGNIPGSVWAYRGGLPAELVDKVRRAFYNVADEDKKALGEYGKYKVKRLIPTKDSDYDIIRETAEHLGI